MNILNHSRGIEEPIKNRLDLLYNSIASISDVRGYIDIWYVREEIDTWVNRVQIWVEGEQHGK